MLRTSSLPTKHFTLLKPHHPPIGISQLRNLGRWTDITAQKSVGLLSSVNVTVKVSPPLILCPTRFKDKYWLLIFSSSTLFCPILMRHAIYKSSRATRGTTVSFGMF